MATLNPFDLLGNDDSEDPSQLIQKIEPKKALAPSAAAPTQQQQAKPAAAKLPSRPPPPAEAVREEKSESARGRGGRGYGRGRGRGRGYNRDSTSNDNSYGNVEISGGQGTPGESDFRKPYERHGGHDGPRGSYGGGRRGGFSNGEAWEGEQGRPRRVFDRHSGSVHGNEMKREGAGRGNWGAQADEFAEVTEEVADEGEKSLNAEKPSGEEETADGNKETSATEIEEKEPENKEMTLEEYEKILEEKRKALRDLKTEERKVDVKEFESMQPLANKKSNDDIFIKLGSLKDKKKELAEKEERAKKSVSINEFLKPAEGERYSGGWDRRRGRGGPREGGGGEPAEGERYSGGRGRGRGRGGPRGGGGGEPAEGERYSGGQGRGRGRDGPRGGGGGETSMSNVKPAPAIEDPGQFPTLGAK